MPVVRDRDKGQSKFVMPMLLLHLGEVEGVLEIVMVDPEVKEQAGRGERQPGAIRADLAPAKILLLQVLDRERGKQKQTRNATTACEQCADRRCQPSAAPRIVKSGDAHEQKETFGITD